MLKQVDVKTTVGEYVKIRLIRSSESGKTWHFDVHSIQGETWLGDIKWFGRWRKYCFFPAPNTIFEQVCLRDISEFIEQTTRMHYNRVKNEDGKL